VRVDDDLAGVVARGQALTDQLIETELLRPGHFHRAVQWIAHGNPPDRSAEAITRWPLLRACLLACRLGEESQQRVPPQV
jgi:hypothetical protein